MAVSLCDSCAHRDWCPARGEHEHCVVYRGMTLNEIKTAQLNASAAGDYLELERLIKLEGEYERTKTLED